MSASEISALTVSSISIFLSLITIIITYCELRKDRSYKRLDIIVGLLKDTRKDDDFAFIFECIDRELPFKYVWPGYFNISESIKKIYGKKINDFEFGRKIDYVLSIYDSFIYSSSKRLLSKKEFNFFHYNLSMIFDNKEIVNFLYSINLYSKNRNIICPFSNLIRYGVKHKYLKSDFYSTESSNYKYLIKEEK